MRRGHGLVFRSFMERSNNNKNVEQAMCCANLIKKKKMIVLLFIFSASGSDGLKVGGVEGWG